MMMGTKLQQFSSSNTSTMTATTSSDQYCSTTNNNNNNNQNLDEFPNGLRVLVVDDDTTCLRILEQMLRKCSYHVTTCCQATVALNLLRERKGCFDLVISDVHMPDMDGFKLLEQVGLEMDLPVIMMSADGRTSAVMRGVKHGACDYLIKPVRLEELKNVWQHVVRKRWSGSRDPEQSASMEETDRHKRAGDDVEYASSANEGTDGSWKIQKKRKDAKEEEDEGELENDDLSTSKKPRVVWSVELHQQFVTAVNQLGIDKAVPKRILELMNVPGLSRENVASHLQKFRLYLKRLSGVAQQQSGIYNNYYGTGESIGRHGSVSRIDIQALAASGQIPPETLAALHAEVFGRPTGSLVLPVMDKAVLIHAASQGGKSIPVECGVAFGQPIAKCPPHISKQFPQSSVSDEDIPSGISTWLPNNLTTVGSTGNHEGLSAQNNNMLMQMLQQQQQQHHHSVLPELSHTINVRPSCLVVPSQSPTSFQAGNISAPFNQSSTLTTSSLNDYSFLSAQSHNVSVGLGQVPCVDTKGDGVLDGYSIPSSISSSVSSCSGRADNVTRWQAQNFAINSSAARQVPGPNMYSVQGSYTSKKINLPDQELGRDLGFVGRGYSVPSRFAVEDLESSIGHVTHAKTYGDNDGGGVKQELNLDFFENAKIGMPVIRQYSPSDLMSVLSK